MQVHRSLHSLPAFAHTVLTIGTFDGVHQGHQRIISALRAEAAGSGAQTVIITFDPHPRTVVQPQQPLQLINTLDEKIALLAQQGIDHLVVVPFTASFAELTAEAYVSEFLVARFRPAVIIIGYDHHFGKGRTGNYALLESLAPVYGYRLVEISPQLLNEIAVSSTKIRKAIAGSDIAVANSLLGYPFFFHGTVVHGDKLGRTLGYPTANLVYNQPEKIRLGHGVYAVRVVVRGRLHNGMLSVGTRPTLAHSDEKVEVHLFDFNEEIYGETMNVSVVGFLRRQERYPSLAAMVEQLHLDATNAKALLPT